MKTINVDFDDQEFDRLTRAKGERSWRDFILSLAPREEDKKE